MFLVKVSDRGRRGIGPLLTKSRKFPLNRRLVGKKIHQTGPPKAGISKGKQEKGRPCPYGFEIGRRCQAAKKGKKEGNPPIGVKRRGDRRGGLSVKKNWGPEARLARIGCVMRKENIERMQGNGGTPSERH